MPINPIATRDTGSVNAGRVLVTVPTDDAMAAEPAATVAKAQQVKIAIVAVLAIAGITLSPELSTNIDTLIQSAVAVAFGVYSLWAAWRQGQDTRAHVYAPSTVAKIAEAAQVDVLPGSPADAEV